MKLSQLITNAKSFLAKAETVAASVLKTIDHTIDDASPFVNNVLGILPGTQPYVAAFDDVKALADAVEGAIEGGKPLPQEIIDAYNKAKDSLHKAFGTAAPAPAPKPAG